MAAKRHDWLKYKEDYFNSDIDEIIQFFDSRDTVVSKNTFQRNTQGWQKEKQEYKRKVFGEKQKKVAKDPDVIAWKNQLLRGKQNILKFFLNQTSNKKLTIRDAEINYKVLKTELGEALVISENKNMNDTKIELGDDYKAFMRAIYADN